MGPQIRLKTRKFAETGHLGVESPQYMARPQLGYPVASNAHNVLSAEYGA